MICYMKNGNVSVMQLRIASYTLYFDKFGVTTTNYRAKSDARDNNYYD